MQHIDRPTVRVINMFDMRHECECIYVEVDVYYRVSDKHFFAYLRSWSWRYRQLLTAAHQLQQTHKHTHNYAEINVNQFSQINHGQKRYWISKTQSQMQMPTIESNLFPFTCRSEFHEIYSRCWHGMLHEKENIFCDFLLPLRIGGCRNMIACCTKRSSMCTTAKQSYATTHSVNSNGHL